VIVRLDGTAMLAIRGFVKRLVDSTVHVRDPIRVSAIRDIMMWRDLVWKMTPSVLRVFMERVSMMMCAYVIQDMTVCRVIRGRVTECRRRILSCAMAIRAVLQIPVYVPYLDTMGMCVINLIVRPVWKVIV